MQYLVCQQMSKMDERAPPGQPTLTCHCFYKHDTRDNSTFTSLQEWKLHFRKFHSRSNSHFSRKLCDEKCSANFVTLKKKAEHYLKHHTMKQYYCENMNHCVFPCMYPSRSLREYKMHIKKECGRCVFCKRRVPPNTTPDFVCSCNMYEPYGEPLEEQEAWIHDVDMKTPRK